ncbi:hypothetical protein IFM89_010617 [Coptis chinensis]|uniref:Uncharacterized protein n=1 Tax=Coptis chinensis TaxID=261450 RepID=A0A835ILM0_9MAGN|nr:hypothetical protein IFM89_010617 [Coptis chinensis]
MKKIEDNNTLVFIVDIRVDKKKIKDVVKKMYDIQTKKVNTLIRYLAYNSCTGSVRCTGMTSMAHTVCHQISFLLDDDSSIPFSVDDISKSMEQIDISDIEPPPLIRETSGFMFLLPRVE